MADSELDQLERDLTQAAEIWFSAPLHMKLARLIEIARGEVVRWQRADRIVCPPAIEGIRVPDIFKMLEDVKREQFVVSDAD